MVAKQSAAGNSNTVINYSQADNSTWNGVSYYRLRQTDLNGQETIYGPISTSCVESDNSMIGYPNPNQGEFTIEISNDEAINQAQIHLIDVTGKLISTRTLDIPAGTTQIVLKDNDLQMGTYIVQLVGGNQALKPIKVVVN